MLGKTHTKAEDHEGETDGKCKVEKAEGSRQAAQANACSEETAGPSEIMRAPNEQVARDMDCGNAA